MSCASFLAALEVTERAEDAAGELLRRIQRQNCGKMCARPPERACGGALSAEEEILKDEEKSDGHPFDMLPHRVERN